MTVHRTRDLEQITSREQPQTQGLTPAQPIVLFSTRIPFWKGTVCTYRICLKKRNTVPRVGHQQQEHATYLGNSTYLLPSLPDKLLRRFSLISSVVLNLVSYVVPSRKKMDYLKLYPRGGINIYLKLIWEGVWGKMNYHWGNFPGGVNMYLKLISPRYSTIL